MSELTDLCERVALACRVLGIFELTLGTTGHVSARLPGTDRIAIRARGPAESGVRYTTADQVIEIGLDGRRRGATNDGYATPLEVYIHTEIYRARPDVNSVIHVHPSTVVVLTICDKPLLPIYGAYDPPSLRPVLDGIPTYDRSILIERPDLGQELASVMGSSQICLMRGHGITTAANSVEEAALFAIHVNEMATMTYRANLLGNVRPISKEDQDTFRKFDMYAGYGERQVGVPSGRAANLWKYYVRLAEERRGQPLPGL